MKKVGELVDYLSGIDRGRKITFSCMDIDNPNNMHRLVGTDGVHDVFTDGDELVICFDAKGNGDTA